MGGVILNFDGNLQADMALRNQNVSSAVSANLYAASNGTSVSSNGIIK